MLSLLLLSDYHLYFYFSIDNFIYFLWALVLPFYMHLFVCAPSLNGNCGEWTNSDDESTGRKIGLVQNMRVNSSIPYNRSVALGKHSKIKNGPPISENTAVITDKKVELLLVENTGYPCTYLYDGNMVVLKARYVYEHS